MTSKVTDALVWIKSILDDENVQYQVVGGLAANIHGGKRPIADIDMYIPYDSAEVVLKQVREYISKPLSHYLEGAWDLEYFQLIYRGQKVEIGLSPGAKIMNHDTGEWVEQAIDFSLSVVGNFHGVEVPTMPKSELVAYKSLLGREVDIIDISEISK